MAPIRGFWQQGLITLLLVQFIAAAGQAGSGSQWKLLHDKGALLAAPKAGAPVVAEVGPKDRLLQFERKVDWLRVGIFGSIGVEGWIRERDLLPLKSAPAPAPLPVIPQPEDLVPQKVARTFLLDIAGSPALSFKAKCTVYGDREGRPFLVFGGFVPRRFRIEADALSCRVRKRDFRGRLTLHLFQDGRKVASRSTAAAYNSVTVRSDGPWGPAKGLRGSTPLIRHHRKAPEHRLVPRHEDPIVPKLVP